MGARFLAARLGRRGKFMRGIIGITWAAVAAFLSAVAIVVAVLGWTSAGAATGASALKGAGTEAYAPMSLFRC